MPDIDQDWEHEFALIEPQLPPGYDLELARTELARLMGDMKPEDALGRRLVREIVVQSAFGDFMHAAFGPTFAHVTGGQPVTPGVIGEAFASHFELLVGMIDSAANVRAGRDSRARFYDSRECSKLRHALAVLEAKLNQLQPPDANPDGSETVGGKDV